jgi:hypothetical protein
LNFIFDIVCLFVCVCAFSLRRESPDMILGDKPLIFEVVLSQQVHFWFIHESIFFASLVHASEIQKLSRSRQCIYVMVTLNVMGCKCQILLIKSEILAS